MNNKDSDDEFGELGEDIGTDEEIDEEYMAWVIYDAVDNGLGGDMYIGEGMWVTEDGRMYDESGDSDG